ncbi:MAG: PEGA domain-containing protein [Candidatus Aminicenantaceae bacterium]
MDSKKFYRITRFIGISFLLFLFLVLASAALKIKVIVDNASVKLTPEIGGKTIAKIPLDTVLEAEEKQGEWYKVSMEREGVQISGFIHEMLVEVVRAGEMAEQEVRAQPGIEKAQAEVVAEIEYGMEQNRKLIRQEKKFDIAIDSLRPLIAKVFRITDDNRQREIGCEIFLWVGLAYAGKGDEYSALKEFKNMFEVDQMYAKEITRNIYDPKVVVLIQQAEREYLGLATDYSVEISTEPKEAEIEIDGKVIGSTPEVYKTTSPVFMLEIKKEGYKSIRQEIFLTQATTKKEYILERLGRNVEVRSLPEGARVYLDDKHTGMETHCKLAYVPFGSHKIKLTKENYAEWERKIEIGKGEDTFYIEAILAAKNYEYLVKWGGPNQKIFQQPQAIKVDKNNNIYVVDLSSFKMKKFNPEGKFQVDWGRGGKEFKSLKSPAGIAIDNQGNVYVTDKKNHCVMKFDKEGRYIKKWGKEGSGNEEFISPLGITIDSNSDIYIADSGNNRIKKYTHLGILKKIWGKYGTSDGDFFSPTAVAVNQKDEVFALDRKSLQKFSSEGEFIASWGKAGLGDGEFSDPMGMYIDQYNYIYVADSGNNRIQKFDGNGKFITKWGTRGVVSGQMNFPVGIAIDSRGYVFVVERNSHRLQIFGIKAASESKSNL